MCENVTTQVTQETQATRTHDRHVAAGPPRQAGNGGGNKAMSRCLIGMLILQGLTLAAVWKGGDGAAPAYGELPDGGVADRRQMVDELHNLNAKMDRLLSLMESGRLQVKLAPGGAAADDDRVGPEADRPARRTSR